MERKQSVTEYIEQLSMLCKSYHEREEFQVGDIVTWKRGMQDKHYPKYGDVAIVSALDPGQVDPTNDTDSVYFKTPVDVQLGMIADGDYRCFWYDGNRLTHWMG